jgi:hypothetical protein
MTAAERRRRDITKAAEKLGIRIERTPGGAYRLAGPFTSILTTDLGTLDVRDLLPPGTDSGNRRPTPR